MVHHNFRLTHSRTWGSKPWKWHEIYGSPPGEYPFTLFQNPISWPSCHTKCRKTMITKKYRCHSLANIVHCNWQFLCVQKLQQTLFPCANWHFSVFCQGEFRKQKFHILLILTGKNASQKVVSGMYLGFKACWIQCCRLLQSLYNKQFLKNHNFRQTFQHFVDSDWVQNHWNCLNGDIFRVQGMLNPMALVASLYDKWYPWNITILGEHS